MKFILYTYKSNIKWGVKKKEKKQKKKIDVMKIIIILYGRWQIYFYLEEML